MREITTPKVLYGKAALFCGLGVSSAVLLLIEPSIARRAILLIVCIWAFARLYYFAFYVIERYIDPSFRFSGLVSLLAYLARRRLGTRSS